MKSDRELQVLVGEIRTGLRMAGEPAYRSQLERLVPGVRSYGVRMPAIRAHAAELCRRFPALRLTDACALMDRLAADRGRDELLFGICLLARFSRSFDHLPWSAIRGWMQAIDNWEVCDQLAMQIAGPCVANNLALVDELLALSTHEDVWFRRCAVASTVALNQKGRSHAEETFRVLRPVIADREDMVRKAVAWAVREVCKNDERAALRFLTEQAGKMPPSLLREAARAMSPASRLALTGQNASR
jgi:3-methyladenine DNA glycosylase AlkD